MNGLDWARAVRETVRIEQLRRAEEAVDTIRHMPHFEDVRDRIADILEFDVRMGYAVPWTHDKLHACYAHCVLLWHREQAEKARVKD